MVLTLGDVDVAFDARSETPAGKDPDASSPTLRTYHQLMWSRPLPDGTSFELSTPAAKPYLLHESARGRFELSSDLIVNDHHRRLQHLWADDGERRIRGALRGMRWSIAGTVIFPSGRIAGQQTVNQHRGIHHRIKDRFDLTLECIRRHYEDESSPLEPTLARYADFFALFRDFRGYTDFFFLQDLVRTDGGVRFYLPFGGFDLEPLPRDVDTYVTYCRRMNLFFRARARRIRQYVHTGLSPSQRAAVEARHWAHRRSPQQMRHR